MSKSGRKKSYTAPTLVRFSSADQLRRFAEEVGGSPDQRTRVEQMLKSKDLTKDA